MDILVHYYTSNNEIKSNKNFVTMICGTKVYILRNVTSEIKCHISDSKYYQVWLTWLALIRPQFDTFMSDWLKSTSIRIFLLSGMECKTRNSKSCSLIIMYQGLEWGEQRENQSWKLCRHGDNAPQQLNHISSRVKSAVIHSNSSYVIFIRHTLCVNIAYQLLRCKEKMDA